MQLVVHLVGTGHHYQFGAGAKFGSDECTPDDAKAFTSYLIHVAGAASVKLIAEELNAQALHEVGATVSVPQEVAARLRVTHLFCDPDRTERVNLGILDENTVRAFAFMKQVPAQVVQARLQDHWRRREEEWYRRLLESALSPALFVCGANHSKTFAELLRTHGVEVTVEHEGWEA